MPRPGLPLTRFVPCGSLSPDRASWAQRVRKKGPSVMDWKSLREEYDSLLLRERELSPPEVARLGEIEDEILRRWLPSRATDSEPR